MFETRVPPHVWRVEGGGEADRRRLQSRGRPCGAGLLRHHLCPALLDGLGSAPLEAPSLPRARLC